MQIKTLIHVSYPGPPDTQGSPRRLSTPRRLHHPDEVIQCGANAASEAHDRNPNPSPNPAPTLSHIRPSQSSIPESNSYFLTPTLTLSPEHAPLFRSGTLSVSFSDWVALVCSMGAQWHTTVRVPTQKPKANGTSSPISKVSQP